MKSKDKLVPRVPSKKSEEKITRWSKRITIGDTITCIEVEQIENGYLVTKTKDYKDSNGVYKYEVTKVYSKTNPLEAESEFTKETDGLKTIRDLFTEG